MKSAHLLLPALLLTLAQVGCNAALLSALDENGTGADTGEKTEDTADESEPETEEECPEGMICVKTFPYIQTHDTRLGSSDYDSYGCAPGTDESGPEILYRLEVDEPGFLALSLDSMSGDVDIDVHLLRSLDSGDCIDRGHWDAASLLEPGTYYVTADTWVNSGGDEQAGVYTITMGYTRPADFMSSGLDYTVLELGLHAFDQAWLAGDTYRFEYTIIDFSQPSTERRLWTLDLGTSTLMYQELVTHGMGSNHPTDPTLATTFSNTVDSHQSSLGMMQAAEIYTGGSGTSMRIDGLEPGFNDRVRERYIVMHPGDYSTQEFVDDYGYLGRSWGCTVIDPVISTDLIQTLSEGSLMWSYYPQEEWLTESWYLEGFDGL